MYLTPGPGLLPVPSGISHNEVAAEQIVLKPHEESTHHG